MTTIARTLATTALALLAVGLTGPPATAQEAFTYLVRTAGGAYTAGDGPVELDFSEDQDPLRVVQGPEVTWVVPRGDSLTRTNATMILSRNAPVSPGPGDLMIRGWRPAEVASWDSFSVALRRGEQDREVAGRTAHHYVLESYIERTGAVAGNEQRYEFDADLWILPDMPHSWAPFGFGTQSLPTLVPRLRDVLDDRLGELGLVGRAIIRMDFALLDDGRETGGSDQVTGFEISELKRTEPPRSPGVVVDRSVMTAVEDGLLEDPAVLCAGVTNDELPASLGEVPDAARGVIMAIINNGCGSPELYFTMLEDRLEADPDALCARVTGAADPEALADSVFTAPQKDAFMEMLTEADRVGFHGELRRYCRGRSAG